MMIKILRRRRRRLTLKGALQDFYNLLTALGIAYNVHADLAKAQSSHATISSCTIFMLTWPLRSLVHITCDKSGGYDVQHVTLIVVFTLLAKIVN